MAPAKKGAFERTAFTWPNEPPADIPFERSDLFTEVFLTGIREGWLPNAIPSDQVHFTGRYAAYAGADTWYPSWSLDGDLYTPWTDGKVGSIRASSACAGAACMSTTGFARVSGEDPFNLSIKDAEGLARYHGRYPSASLHYDGVWYYGTYALDNENHEPGAAPKESSESQEVSKGPSSGSAGAGMEVWAQLRRRSDRFDPISDPIPDLVVRLEPRKTMANYSDNLFGEAAPNNRSKARMGPEVKFGAPPLGLQRAEHVVDLGQNLAHQPNGASDPRLYLVGHGASSPMSPTSWMQGSEVYLARGRPDVERINDAAAWEFYAGRLEGTAAGLLETYIMCISTPTFSPFTTKQFDTSYSANFAYHSQSSPVGSGYHWTLQEVELRLGKSQLVV
ncbi:hypothetical protein AK812_SmicGene36063 [Symbiodinium microadriaticum]|uniref:Uncharacterized protein n=1 Tax=Symbiodinium microadriaticum TaxID=2951 RepID=A0A1Q9CJV4_SYMMI|nr:hypothetical protein AK812_SmicGene36063 [Symbiodinium microadriaticum]